VSSATLPPGTVPAAGPGAGPGEVPAMPARRPPRPRLLIAVSAIVAGVLLTPLAFLLLMAHSAGGATVTRLLLRRLTLDLLVNTVQLLVVVTVLCAVIGTLAAWCVERTDLPGRGVWAALVVVPLAIPDFVVAFGWSSLWTWVSGFRGAVLVMTLAVYPLVYLPVSASLRGADPAQEEVARGMGVGRLRTFWSITLGQARGAILGGCLLVALVVLAEYGAFEVLGYQTFTTEIFAEFEVSFNLPAACALSLVLVVIGVLLLVADGGGRGHGRVARTGRLTPRTAGRARLGRATLPVLGLFAALTIAALGVPVGACIYWLVTGPPASFTGVSLPSAAFYTAGYSAAAAALATVMALPVALLAVRHDSRAHRFLERSTYLVMAMPGLVIALAFSYVAERYFGGFLYQSGEMLVFAYAILFFPLALVGVRASLAQSPAGLEEVAGSLGRRRLSVLGRVTLPLVLPGLAAAFCLVFLSAVTELTATLVLLPTGVETLATQFWAYQQNTSYAQAAPFALAMIVIAAVPSYLLGRWFDRLPSRAAVAP
jgi:iron(III) transport system permease protein